MSGLSRKSGVIMYYLAQYYVSPCSNCIIQVLDGIGVEYFVSSGYRDGTGGFVTFYIDERDVRMDRIQMEFPVDITNSNREYDCHGEAENRVVRTTYFPQYTEEERRQGKLLEIRCITAKLDPANYEDVYRETCVFDRSHIGTDMGHHKIQANPLEIRRMFKWGNSHFFSGSITTGGLFCDDRAVSIMECAGLKGLQYGPVLKWKTNVPVSNVHQILPSNTIPDGAFIPIRDVEPYTCEICGMQMLRISGKKPLYGIRDELLNCDIDFCRTLPLFLDCSAERYSGGRTHYIISQRAYRVLKENKMCRGVEFTPLTLLP